MHALVQDTEVDVIRRVMDVNFFGSVYCTKFALPTIPGSARASSWACPPPPATAACRAGAAIQPPNLPSRAGWNRCARKWWDRTFT